MEYLKQLFFNDAGRLRSGWRLGIFVGVLSALSYLAINTLRVAYALIEYFSLDLNVFRSIADLVAHLLMLFLSLAAGYICARILEGLPWRSLGLIFHSRWLRDLLFGSAIGVGTLALAVALAIIGGGLRFSVSAAGASPVATTLISSAGVFIVGALGEEALFRGYPLQTFIRPRLFWLGALITSLAFAYAHQGNPNAGSLLGFINTALAGVWLAVAYLKTRSLWFPLGVHWAWNWALGSLFGLPVSGITKIAPHPILIGTDLGPAWLTGAGYGIEAGIACTLAVVISTIFVWRTRLVSATEDLKRLTSQENPAVPSIEVNREPAS